ncbi:hypothetical protein HOF78_01085 [Candidatus Woesearchaeota archaeon]|jgi:hypothetical protein|nr:hypothetical protein [Candidatus Woesearchaeota archaeon]MBT6045020.1 hypothetical protein [Candidatus Woesearchaeota archaeon]
MGRAKKKEVNREFVFALMIVVIFVALLLTWSFISSVEENSEGGSINQDYYEEGLGKVSLEIVSSPEGTEDGGGE